MSSKFKKIISLILVFLVFTFGIFNTQLIAFALQTETAVAQSDDEQVLFTYDSDIFVGSAMTVDLASMAQKDEASDYADALCKWYKDGVLVEESLSYTFKAEDISSTFIVEVSTPDKTISSYKIVPVQKPQNYGYDHLTTEEKSAYESIDKGVAAFDEKIEISSQLNLDIDSLNKIVNFFLSDNPDSLFFTNNFSYVSTTKGVVLEVYPEYHLTQTQTDKSILMQAQAQFKNKLFYEISQMYTEVTDLSDYNKALWIHDKVCDLVSYAYSDNDQSAYGALVEGEAVCSGYSKLFDLMLKCVGIKTFIVKGYSYLTQNNYLERHAWSLLWLDKKCVYADSTWDDQQKDIYHLYFARSLEEFSEDHVQILDYYSEILPSYSQECECMQYFNCSAPTHKVCGDNYSTELADMATKESDTEWNIIAFDPTGNELYNWLCEKSNLSSLLGCLNIKGSVLCKINRLGFNKSIGSEVHVTLQLKCYTLSGVITKSDRVTGDIDIKLIKSGETQPKYEISVSGNSSEYLISDVAPGKYTMIITQKGSVDSVCEFEVKADMNKDIELLMLGDVNDDNKITITDATRIQRSIADLDVLSEQHASMADANRDDKLTITDATVIQRFVANLIDSL